MEIKILNEQHFQVLSTNFTIGASNEGYTLMFSADGDSFSPLFSVDAGVERMVTSVANGAYYYLAGNATELTVNWQRECHSGGGGGGSEYILPKATATKLGGVKIGSGISIDADGKISATGGGGSVPTFDLQAIFAMSDEEKAAMFPTIKAAIESGSFIAYGALESEDGTLCFANKAAVEGDNRVFFECYGSHSSNPNTIMVKTYRLNSDGSTEVENFSAEVGGGGGSTALNLNDIKDNWSEDDRKNLYNDLVSKFTNGEYFNATFKGEIAGEYRLMGNPCINYDDGYGSINFNFYCEYGGVKNYFIRINRNGGFEDLGV